MNIFVKILSVFLLLAVFALTYGAVKNMDDKKNGEATNDVTVATNDFSRDKQTTGEGGGVHYMRNLIVEDQTTFHRIKIETALNRSSVLENIETPLTTVEIKNDNGCYLALHLSDTTQILEDENIFLGKVGKTSMPDKQPITSIDVKRSSEEGQVVQIGLQSCEAQFKLGSDPKSPGHIWLDVLK